MKTSISQSWTLLLLLAFVGVSAAADRTNEVTFSLAQRHLQDIALTESLLNETQVPLTDTMEDHDDEHDDHVHDEHDDHVHDEHDDHEHDHDEDVTDSKPWAEVIIASLTINLVTLVGVVFIAYHYLTKRFSPNVATDDERSRRDWKFTSNMIPSFACGALLATNVFLILPEAIVMIQSFLSEGEEDDHGDEHDHRLLAEEGEEPHDDIESAVAWRFGVSLLAGFLLPIVLTLIFPHYHEPKPNEAPAIEFLFLEQMQEQDGAGKEEKQLDQDDAFKAAKEEDSASGVHDTLGEACESAGCDNGDHHCHEHHSHDDGDCDDEGAVGVKTDDMKAVDHLLATSILLGDTFHNFTDGVLVGTSFLLCDRSLAIAISLATIYHEIAQEIADYFLLTKHCNLRPATALALNFLCGLSVVFGAILILTMDISSNATGCILATGGGVYLYVAVAECLPRAKEFQVTRADKGVSLLSFLVGAVPIGLVLLNHGHCVPHSH